MRNVRFYAFAVPILWQNQMEIMEKQFPFQRGDEWQRSTANSPAAIWPLKLYPQDESA